MTDTVNPVEGKYYIDRRGRIHGPMIKYSDWGFFAPKRIDPEEKADWYDNGRYSLVDEDDYDLIKEASNSPVRETIKREIVPGYYGNFWIATDERGRICVTMPNNDDDSIGESMDADDLRAAAELFTALADFAENG